MHDTTDKAHKAAPPETRRALQKARERRRLMAVPFFAVLALLTVVSLILPLRPTESRSEKRTLTPFPAFSVSALLSGDYFDGITAWYSDTFPGREGWLKAGSLLEELRGVHDVTLYGDMGTADEIPTPGASAAPSPTAVPTATPTPASTPTLPPAPTAAVTSPPTESVEHWGGIDADDDADIIFGTVLQIGDAAFAYYGFSQYGSDRHAAMVNNCADVLSEYGVTVYDILIPTSVGVLVSSDDMEKLGCSDQGASISYIFGQESETVQKVNVFNTLVAHNDEYLYFRTDHHWTALGAYYAYGQFCAAAGLEPAALEDFGELVLPGFKGSFYWSCNQNSRLKEDTVYAYDPPGDIEMQITTAEGSTFPWPVLTDMSKADANSKYMTFLGGDHPLTVITNNDLPDAPNCAVIKDSFGNPFSPFLTQNYHNVYVIDYRTYSAMTLRYFVQYYDVDDVLFAESLAMAQGDGTLDLLEWFCA